MRMGVDVQIAGPDGAFAAYIAEPPSAPAPGLVLIQYISGVNRVMRTLADEFAESGYLVACPDLFWRQEPDIRINNDPAKPDPAEQKRALDLNAAFVDGSGLVDLQAMLGFLRAHPSCSGKAGALGYCLGGRLAYLMATRTDADCAVGYYGVNIQRYLDEADRIGRPLLLHVAENDELCPANARDEILKRLGAVPQVTIQVHPKTKHAFALRGGHNFDAEAAQRADRQSLAFLALHLKH
jgi:carboxymethylenebutenolidase